MRRARQMRGFTVARAARRSDATPRGESQRRRIPESFTLNAPRATQEPWGEFRKRSSAIARRVEPEALDPALDLLAVLVERACDSRHIALMLAQGGHHLVAHALIVLAEDH